jgi:ferredoxin
MTKRIAHTANVPGDFYVEDGCCLSCGMPTTVAADLFEYDNGGHCYVRKQPIAPDEIDRMVSAFQVQDVGCIRYKGSSRIVQIRLVESGEGEQCDLLDSELKTRTHTIKAERAAAHSIKTASARAEAESSVLKRLFDWLRRGS